jgi:ABC-type nitrate/sulfonate/bicarbonate transport system substrate-binding protein
MLPLEKNEIDLGYLPLLDCVALIWAHRQGYFQEFGLQVNLVKEASWASLRDRLAFGVLDAAHCLSAILPAAAIGSDKIGVPLTTPLTLSVNTAFISLSQALCYELHIEPDEPAYSSAHKVVEAIRQGRNIRFAQVFNHSLHHYCLREWLARADEKVAADCKLASLPPSYMVEALSRGMIDGFCAGEPWNSQGEISGVSQIIATSREIIPPVADKVLATTSEWAARHPNTLCALTTALIKAQHDIHHTPDFAPIYTALREYDIIPFVCSEQIHVRKYHAIQQIIRNLSTLQTSPRASDMHWLLSQIKKWNDNTLDESRFASLAKTCVDVDCYQSAVAAL